MVVAREIEWRLIRRDRLRLRRWDDEVVIYDDRSGETHLLDDVAGRVVERLLVGKATEAELRAQGRPRAGDGPPGDSVRVHGVLERLRRLGLVKPNAP